MKNLFIAICWLVSLGVLSLHAESFRTVSAAENINADAMDAARSAALANGIIPAPRLDTQVAPKRFVGINFSAPLHLAGHKPATGNGSIMPAGLSGNPQVVAGTSVLPHQPLLLNSDLANGPCCYEEGIQVLVPEISNRYVISFDMASQHLGDSFNQFQLWLNDQSEPLLRFRADHLLLLEGVGAIASFMDDHLLHIQIDLDLSRDTLYLAINGNPIYSGDYHVESLQSLQFIMTIEGGATPDQVNPEATIALDNIVVANGAYQYVNLQTAMQRHTDTSLTDSHSVSFVTQIRNISDFGADNVVLTQLLPTGTNIDAIRSDELECESGLNSIICRTPFLDAMSEAKVYIQLSGDPQLKTLDVTSIATSDNEDIDNFDNRSKARFGGSGTILLLAALMLLWFTRAWRQDP